ncbi:MAG TPA: paraquat-inducible protein A [Tepidisphaeraceae bacterium]|jgi:paraquat-inducible protein A|nr:paraquat-inducible protein A [Tepidisphaeraceae bacterium]
MVKDMHNPTATDNGQRTTDRVLTCRRCGKTFTPPTTKIFLPSCPHCGTSLHPLWHKLHNNRNAAVLAVFAIAVLTAGILLPFISMSQLGQERIFSLLGGIRELYQRDHLFLAAILLIFSVIFPYAKLIALLIATSRLANLSGRTRHRLHKIAQFTGRYSLLDILVVAIIIVVVKFQDLAEARALPGTYLFTLAVFLSIAAGFCVNLDPPQSHHE